jgi:catechol 2,3-dioxygenase-like lactoylglutathione lyase family enzyme
MRIGLVDVFVDDQDRARAFYTNQLGLQIKDDAPYGPGARWLTVVSPDDPDGTELLLAPLNDAAKALQASRRETGTPAVSFSVDDCQRRYQELSGGASCSTPSPGQMDYGGLDAVFEDGCGNLLNVHGEAPADPAG